MRFYHWITKLFTLLLARPAIWYYELVPPTEPEASVTIILIQPKFTYFEVFLFFVLLTT